MRSVKSMKAMIVRAGRSIRLMPETEGIPKCMIGGVGEQKVLDSGFINTCRS